MNWKQKIGQLLVVGFHGTEVNEDIQELIVDYHVGNVILFERNYETPEQIFNLIQNLQRLAMAHNGVPLFVMIDQENGIVTRIHDGITVFPGNMAQSAGATIDETRQIGYYTGEGLKALGINFNLAPSADINNNPKNPVIGSRSFGQEPEAVAMRVNACILGLQDAGVIATAKHFPGHGDTEVDSHLGLATILHNKERLETVELYPFKEAIKNGVKAIMSAHIKFPAYDQHELPATLSYDVLTTLLREELKFEGLIITDCMEMKAIDETYGTCKAVPMAISAGADLVCISNTKSKQIGAIQAIDEAIADGVLNPKRIEDSLERILAHKKTYNIDEFLKTSFQDTRAKLYRKEAKLLSERISDQSITMVRNNGLIPIKANNILVIAPDGRVMTGADGTKMAPNFAKFFKEKITNKNIEIYQISNTPEQNTIEKIIEKARQAELVIMCTQNAMLIEAQLELARRLAKANKNMILIPMRNPYDCEVLQEIECCIVPYEYTIRAIDSLIKVLMGEIEAVGKLPIDLEV